MLGAWLGEQQHQVQRAACARVELAAGVMLLRDRHSTQRPSTAWQLQVQQAGVRMVHTAMAVLGGCAHHAGHRGEVDEQVQADDAEHDAADAVPGRHATRWRPSPAAQPSGAAAATAVTQHPAHG